MSSWQPAQSTGPIVFLWGMAAGSNPSWQSTHFRAAWADLAMIAGSAKSDTSRRPFAIVREWSLWQSRHVWSGTDAVVSAPVSAAHAANGARVNASARVDLLCTIVPNRLRRAGGQNLFGEGHLLGSQRLLQNGREACLGVAGKQFRRCRAALVAVNAAGINIVTPRGVVRVTVG